MPSVNKAILIGHLGRDPEVKFMPNGDPVCNFSLATTENWKNKDGERQEKTVWHRCNAYGKLAEIIGQYVKKGQPIYVEGSITSDTYKDKETGVEKTSYGVRVNAMQMLASRDHTGAAPQQAPAAKPAAESSGFDDFEDDIPF